MSAELPPAVCSFTDRRGSVGQSAGPSRLPEHKRADRGNCVENPSTGVLDFDRSAVTTRLSTKPGTKLREECVADDDAGRSVRSRSWAAVTREWRAWIDESNNSAAIFMEEMTGEEAAVPLENRFMAKRRKELYAKLKDLERGVRDAYGESLNTAMLTFTASNTSGAGDWLRCPANHLDDLLGSWSAVRRELARVLDGRRWEYVRMLEPHESGYAHVHVAVFVDGYVDERMFQPVMDAHVRNCLPAASEAHTSDSDAVSVNRDVSNLGAYLSSYVMKYGEDPLDAPEHVQRFNALLWATGRRRWSVSQGAQEYMTLDLDEQDDLEQWHLTHFEIRGERFPNYERGEGAVMMEITEGAGLDPPPVRE